MYLGIEIGGTKLQFGVGTGGEIAHLERVAVDRSRAAKGIQEAILGVGRRLVAAQDITAIGIGFGGPVDPLRGKVVRSHHIDGWDEFPIVEWLSGALGRPVALGNDSAMAGLGEARFGAGRGQKVVFYSNVGSGIGGSLVIDGELYVGGSGITGEVGHCRPGLDAVGPEQIVELAASGWGMTTAAREHVRNPPAEFTVPAAELLERCHGDVEELDGKILARAMADGNELARDVFLRGIQTYGWALAQVITLLGPNVLVIGGGVPQIGEELYLDPLRREIERYVYPPLRDKYEVRPAALGEEVVVHGALALAAAVCC